MHRGQSLVVWAIREGREAAKAVDESLMGYSYLQTCKIFKEELTRERPIAIIRNIKGKGVLSGGKLCKVRPF